MTTIRITADDLGGGESIDSAVIELNKKDVVTHAALMATGQSFKNAATLATANPDLVIGVHFTLTQTTPLTSCPLLTDKSGHFLSRPKLLLRLIFFRRKIYKQIQDELYAQISKINQAGLSINFINGHQHVHTLPVIREVIALYAYENNIYVQLPKSRIVWHSGFISVAKKIIMRFFSLITEYRLDSFSISHNDIFISGFSQKKRDFSPAGYKKVISDELHGRSISDSTIDIMVHPASSVIGLNELWGNDHRYSNERVQEYRSLCSFRPHNFIIESVDCNVDVN